VGYFEQALSVLEHLPEQRDMLEQAIELRLALCRALQASGALERILACLREAKALAEILDDPRRLGRVSDNLSNHFRRMGAYDQASAAAQHALALATASGEVVLQALANVRLGQVYQMQGDNRRAIACLGQTAVSLDEARRRERLGQASMPVMQPYDFVQPYALLAWCHAELGTFAEGRALGDEGLRVAEAVAHPQSLMMASWGIGRLALRQGDLRRALPRLERALSICQDADNPALFPLVAATLGTAYTLDGRVADAV
jgi:tetratricopeptide (TPR) repeat protein